MVVAKTYALQRCPQEQTLPINSSVLTPYGRPDKEPQCGWGLFALGP